jgi:signal transduction histidine kinase
MFFAHRPRLRSFGLRLALVSGALFFLATSILIAAVSWIAASAVYDQLTDALQAEHAALVRQGSDDAIASAIRAAEREPGGRFVYGLATAPGSVIAGALPAEALWKTGVEDRPWPAGLRNAAPAEEEGRERLVTFGAPASSGAMLVVGVDGEGLIEAEEALLQAALWGIPLAAVFGFGGAVAVSARYRRRVEAVEARVGDIMGHDITARVPLNGSGDEIDRLAGALNAMLDRLAASTEGLRQISSDIAHELRTPLGRLRQTLEAAGSSTELAAAHHGINDAIDETDQLLVVFSALLRIAQVEGGAQRAFVPVDLSALLHRLAEIYSPVAEDNGHALVLHLPPGSIIDGDADLLLQLFANLLDNALRHTPAGTAMYLCLDPDEAGDRPPLSGPL